MRRTVTILSGTGTKGMEREHAFDIEQILSRIAAGDRQAFAGIVERFQRPLYGFLGRMGLGQSQADELAQETFLRAWRGHPLGAPRTLEARPGGCAGDIPPKCAARPPGGRRKRRRRSGDRRRRCCGREVSYT